MGLCSGMKRRETLNFVIMNTAGCKERPGASGGSSNLKSGILSDFLSENYSASSAAGSAWFPYYSDSGTN